jgi:hypothetical protein
LLRPIELDVPPRPRTWRKVQESSADHHSFTYSASGVGLKGAGVDLDVCITRKNCSALFELDVPPRELELERRKFRKVLRPALQLLTSKAVLLSKVHV